MDLGNPLVGGVGNNDPADSLHPAAPTIAVAAGSLVVSAADVVGSSVTIDAGNPFTALPVLAGDDAAYDIAPVAGSYGAAWLAQGTSQWCASTAAFHAAP